MTALAILPTMDLLTTCPDCGREWSTGEQLRDAEVLSFPEPPHRLVVFSCDCDETLGVWLDRNGKPDSTEPVTRGK